MEFLQGFWEAVHTGTLPDLGNWSYVLIAVLVFIEGPSVTLVAGAMAATGLLRVDLVFIAAFIGNFLADQFWYWLGRLGGHRGFLFRFGWFRNHRSELEQLEVGMHEHGVKLYLMSKISMGLLTIPTLVSAGLTRVHWYRLAGVSILFEPLWTGFLVFAGYRLGEQISRMERGLQIGALIGGIVLLLVFIAFYRRMFQRLTHARKATLES